jgi:hypothetical protein
MIVDDLVQGAVGWDLSIVGRPDMLDVNFFGGLVGHRFFRCRLFCLSAIAVYQRQRPFTSLGGSSHFRNVFGAGLAMTGKMGGELEGSCGSVALPQGPFRALSGDRIGLLKSRAAAAHESSSDSTLSPRPGRGTARRRAKLGVRSDTK